MGLFWIRLEKFLAFDRINQQYLKEKYGIKLPYKAPEYMKILDNIKKKMASGEIKEKTFYELSANANSFGHEYSDNEYSLNGVYFTLNYGKNKRTLYFKVLLHR